MMQQATVVDMEGVLAEFKKNGVTHAVIVPDSETNYLYPLLMQEPSITVVMVVQEGLAMATAAGLAMGGKKPVVLIQNTGMLESGDSIRGWGILLKMPVVMMVGYAGWNRHGTSAPHGPATYTEPMLHAFGIHYYLVENNDDVPRFSSAFQEAEETARPVAVLVATRDAIMRSASP